MSQQVKKFRTGPDFPVRPFEQFVVRDWSGKVVETWQHVHSTYGKTSAHHTYAIDGYGEAM